jgi:hypothetical protein
MFSTPQDEHKWLARLAGNWAWESTCVMGPDAPPQVTKGTDSGRVLGEMWVLFEMTGEMDGGKWQSMFTLGYDTTKKAFVGTFVGSMMSELWVYEGAVDGGGKVLTLNCEGPRFDGKGRTKYQDIIEWVTDDHFVFRSRMLGEDGKWTEFMKGDHRRLK